MTTLANLLSFFASSAWSVFPTGDVVYLFADSMNDFKILTDDLLHFMGSVETV
ncbi:hypothetical protein GLYMA_04G007350v4 [Glycine max]|nr:hypothetical protein GLYMA_04G007350v4 [Glycine max]KAH1109184.1 hypothetical protein GYH30_008539 [Glycine max]